MIHLTRLNGRPFVLNAEQIKTIEETPDTLVTLLSGTQLVVLEAMNEVVAKAVEYARQIRTFQAA
jgi:flagellar protein FlbD